MKILLIHNFYQISGGEDSVFKNEKELLQANGVDVDTYTVHNDSINSSLSKILIIFSSVFNVAMFFRFYKYLSESKPDIVHVHNFFPIISPSIFWVCKMKNIPVVHTLHNFRIVCPTATLMFDGKVTERSITHNSWWAIKKAVYKNSAVGTASLAAMIEFNKRIGTWNRAVTKLIALTDFAKQKYIEAGIIEKNIIVKPNFVNDSMQPNFYKEKYAIFVGRISEEKGIENLLKTWEEIDYPLIVIGDGPLREILLKNSNSDVIYKGKLNKKQVLKLVSNAKFLIMASTWYEGLPMVLVEALSVATPCIVPRLGGMASVVKDDICGLCYQPNNVEDMRAKIQMLIDDQELAIRLSQGAYKEFMEHYTSNQNYRQLICIYKQAIQEVSGKKS
jgi:glycosyltransferase involved in cell wall biosynthesis